jgi:hypothetical protein
MISKIKQVNSKFTGVNGLPRSAVVSTPQIPLEVGLTGPAF